MTDRLSDLLHRYRQEHLLRFVDQLTAEERGKLESQIGRVDFDQLARLVAGDDKQIDWHQLARRAEPPSAIRIDQAGASDRNAAARLAGESALRSGQVAVLLVAGGQGTRLGFDLPKGIFPIGPVSGRTLFQMQCDRLSALGKRYGSDIPLYIMTSPATDAETRDYFAHEDRCGLKQDRLRFFCQGQMPAVDAVTGQVLLAGKGELALSPDGHGGIVHALAKSGCLKEAMDRGITHFFYAQIDNPLAELCDPVLIGHHLLAESQMTTQVVKKRFATEKVGNVVSVDGQIQIIEYSDLPEEVAQKRNQSGDLNLWAGNIAIHLFEAAFLKGVTEDAAGLPFHRARKKVPYINADGQRVDPVEPNAIKFERFVFDLLPIARRALVIEGAAEDVFAPVKNADGSEVDTPQAAKAAILNLHARWLKQAGARLDSGVRVEIHPNWALDAEEVREKTESGTHFSTDTLLM